MDFSKLTGQYCTIVFSSPLCELTKGDTITYERLLWKPSTVIRVIKVRLQYYIIHCDNCNLHVEYWDGFDPKILVIHAPIGESNSPPEIRDSRFVFTERDFPIRKTDEKYSGGIRKYFE